MKFPHKVYSLLLAALIAAASFPAGVLAAEREKPREKDDMNMYQNSEFIEKEQPELSEETKKLISLYQRDPSMENYLNLREMVIANYNAVLARKEDKLAALKTETNGKPGGDAIVAEMEEIVQEMYITYWNRINSSMLRFTDPRLLKWSISGAARYDYIPVMGAGESIYVKRTPVTNGEYAEFLNATGHPAPSNWTGGSYPAGEEDYPVNLVSCEDAESYCAWLTEQDGVNTYRLPTESEWELAAGHMPKDADFNCGANDGRTPVEQYAEATRGAHGAVDFWGNVWEWTSTARSDSNGTTILGVKGGSWKSARTDCRSEYRQEGRDASGGYEDVGFRVIQVLKGMEPRQRVELAGLDFPVVSAAPVSAGIALSWEPVEGAVEYQVFAYDGETGLFSMLDRTGDTDFTDTNPAGGAVCRYVVQSISYTDGGRGQCVPGKLCGSGPRRGTGSPFEAFHSRRGGETGKAGKRCPGAEQAHRPGDRRRDTVRRVCLHFGGGPHCAEAASGLRGKGKNDNAAGDWYGPRRHLCRWMKVLNYMVFSQQLFNVGSLHSV